MRKLLRRLFPDPQQITVLVNDEFGRTTRLRYSSVSQIIFDWGEGVVLTVIGTEQPPSERPMSAERTEVTPGWEIEAVRDRGNIHLVRYRNGAVFVHERFDGKGDPERPGTTLPRDAVAALVELATPPGPAIAPGRAMETTEYGSLGEAAATRKATG